MEKALRQKILKRYRILGTKPEEAFDEISRFAAELCETPIALISFIDDSCMWFKSHIGTELTEVDRNHSFCNFMIRDTKLVVVPDAALDERFKHLAVVTDGPKVRFYAGVPLVSPEGVMIGSLCVLGTEPSDLSLIQCRHLERLARLTMQFLESRVSDLGEKEEAVSREQATKMTLQTLIDLAPVGISIVDADNKITAWNKASEDITEWKEEEVLGKSIFDALKGNAANTDRINSQVHEQAKNFSSELEYITKYGKKVDVQISVVPIFDGEGKQAGSMGVSVNISDIRERERRLMEVNRVLKEASAAKSDFLANMSHEIRTPLNGVIAMSELVSMTSLTEDQKRMMNTVQSSANSLMTILSDILDFSKVEAGKLEVEQVSFDLKELVQQALRSIEPIAKTKNLLLNVSLPPYMGKIYKGDPGRIRQVLLNLVSNAVKFTERGEISCALSLTPAVNGKTSLRLEVLDSGIGMSRSQLDKLFQAFSQADASTTRRFGGTGLGLSISQGLVDLMKGEIGVESVEGQGSKFWFTLPLEVADVTEGKTKASGEVAAPLPRMEGIHVLVAEDNSVNQMIAKAMLAKLGITCEIVANGKLALEALQSKKYDLVLMDCQMPEMDGYEATRSIRLSAGSGFESIPIVALTAHAMAGDREKCLAAGMDDYLSKPLHIQNLAKTLGDVVGICKKAI